MSRYKLTICAFSEDETESEWVRDHRIEIANILNSKKKVFKEIRVTTPKKEAFQTLIPGMIQRNTSGFKHEEDDEFYLMFLTPSLEDESEWLDMPVLDTTKTVEEQKDLILSWIEHCQGWFNIDLYNDIDTEVRELMYGGLYA
jgi:hypothetical protein